MATQKRLARTRQRRAWHVRRRVRGDVERPRITVHRTEKHIYAQIVDDASGRTLCQASSLDMKYGGNVDAAKAVGEALGRKAREQNIERAGFDRGRYRYHGRVRALAEAVRSAGVEF